jgi:protein dithiol:quinone oxidoreductase
MKLSAKSRLLGIALVCFATVGAALVSQYVYDMQPCPWCILQRAIFVAIALIALVAAFVPRMLRSLLVLLTLLLAASGAAAALYQHFVAAKSQSCNLTLADRIVSGIGLDHAWPALFEVRASCADAAVSILGVPYEFWSLALYGLLAVAALLVLRAPER